ncbi:MAG: MarR family transcriptional regulator [Candidatus Bathyarchaeota archaeon]|nr:MarR family transcriptional regulator [Candidatus Bathyarchaeota archaeon]
MSVFISAFAFLFIKRIGEANAKYNEAKEVIDEIITSFNTQLGRQETRIEAVKKKITVLSTSDLDFDARLGKQRKDIESLIAKHKSLHLMEKAIHRMDVLEKKMEEASLSTDAIRQKFSEIETKGFRKEEPEAKIESAIPIKREKALAPLTETELAVLEILAAEGEKTAPQIKIAIKLSREHTARLMKKLYAGGYLERSARKVPFTYRLKEEMRRILRKPEQKN